MLMFIYSLLLSDAMGQNLCADGWYSDSSGRGTCSHHGGIMGNDIIPYIPVYPPPIQILTVLEKKEETAPLVTKAPDTSSNRVEVTETPVSLFFAKYKGFIAEEQCVGWVSSGGLIHCWDVYEGKMLHTRMMCSHPIDDCSNTSGEEPYNEAMKAVVEEWRKLTRPEVPSVSK